jgi:hypothetical protein
MQEEPARATATDSLASEFSGRRHRSLDSHRPRTPPRSFHGCRPMLPLHIEDRHVVRIADPFKPIMLHDTQLLSSKRTLRIHYVKRPVHILEICFNARRFRRATASRGLANQGNYQCLWCSLYGYSCDHVYSPNNGAITMPRILNTAHGHQSNNDSTNQRWLESHCGPSDQSQSVRG